MLVTALGNMSSSQMPCYGGASVKGSAVHPQSSLAGVLLVPLVAAILAWH